MVTNCYLAKSKVANYLLEVHNEKISIEEKICKLCKKYECLYGKTHWNALRKFFENPICVKTFYMCINKDGKKMNYRKYAYVKDDITYEEATNVNVHFYKLLAYIREMEEKDNGEYNYKDGKIHCHYLKFYTSGIANDHLYQYLKENNIEIDNTLYDDGNNIGLIVGDILLVEERGYQIWKVYELPM